MGDEIDTTKFDDDDFERFRSRVGQETEVLRSALASNGQAQTSHVIGFELEAWLLDEQYQPVPESDRYLNRLNSELVVPELSLFNIEINGTPEPLGESAFEKFEDHIQKTWQACQEAANEQALTLASIGTLPTLETSHLNLANMSPQNRYFAMNQQILKSRDGRPVRIDIEGKERLKVAHPNVLIEASATSFQVHFQTPPEQLVAAFNASCIISAPLLAVSVNSPFLFGRNLWAETRIPLFEQSVDTSGLGAAAQSRVFFSESYLSDSIAECFEDNHDRFSPLLPMEFTGPESQLKHLCLHNGTVWRWNRPIVDVQDDGKIAIRIEHRALPAGPSIADMAANAAFYVGLVQGLSDSTEAPTQRLSIDDARDNFYQAAKHGLSANLRWFDGQTADVKELLSNELLPLARSGLLSLGVSRRSVDRYVTIIEGRINNLQTGSDWQEKYVKRHGRNPNRLMAAYCEAQASNLPVYQWPV